MIPFPYVLRRRMIVDTAPKTVIINFSKEASGLYMRIYYNGEEISKKGSYEFLIGDTIDFVSTGMAYGSDAVFINDEKVIQGYGFTYSYKVVTNAEIRLWQETGGVWVYIYEE